MFHLKIYYCSIQTTQSTLTIGKVSNDCLFLLLRHTVFVCVDSLFRLKWSWSCLCRYIVYSVQYCFRWHSISKYFEEMNSIDFDGLEICILYWWSHCVSIESTLYCSFYFLECLLSRHYQAGARKKSISSPRNTKWLMAFCSHALAMDWDWTHTHRTQNMVEIKSNCMIILHTPHTVVQIEYNCKFCYFICHCRKFGFWKSLFQDLADCICLELKTFSGIPSTIWVNECILKMAGPRNASSLMYSMLIKQYAIDEWFK